MYVRREVIERIGLLDEALPDGLRGRRLVPARMAGRLSASLYFPAAELVSPRVGDPRHRASASASARPSARSGSAGGTSSTRARSGPPTGALRVVYVTEDTGVGGGHRDIFEHLNRPARARPRGRAVHARRASRTGSTCARPCAASRTTTSWSRRSPSRRDQGRDLVEHRRAGVAGERPARDPGVLRPGHRDHLLPRRRAHAPRGAGLLPPRVPLHDDLLLEPRAPARARPRRRADPARDRPRQLPPARRTSRAATTWCSRSVAPTR